MAEIGSSLGLLTVGEGVETPAQLQALRRLGYDVAQGYLLGRRVPLRPCARSLPAFDALAAASSRRSRPLADPGRRFAGPAAGYSP